MINLSIPDISGLTLATSGKYCKDNIKITLDNISNLSPENIKKNISILGVVGILDTENNFDVNETIIASECTILQDCFNAVIPEVINNKYTYICWIKNKKLTDITTNNQFLFAFNNSLSCAGWRYRNGKVVYGELFNRQYDGVVNIGDVYCWTKVINRYI